MEMRHISPYEEVMDLMNKETKDGHNLWTFKDILNHRLVKSDGKSTVEVEVLWDTGEKTWERD